jgi:hypothetical protein
MSMITLFRRGVCASLRLQIDIEQSAAAVLASLRDALDLRGLNVL